MQKMVELKKRDQGRTQLACLPQYQLVTLCHGVVDGLLPPLQRRRRRLCEGAWLGRYEFIYNNSVVPGLCVQSDVCRSRIDGGFI